MSTSPETIPLRGHAVGPNGGQTLPAVQPADFGQLEAIFQDIADSLRVIAARETRERPEEKAVRLLVEMGTSNVTAIAKVIGVTPRTLYRWPVFKKALERLRAIESYQDREPRAVRFSEL